MDIGTRVRHKIGQWGIGTIVAHAGAGYVVVQWPKRGPMIVRATALRIAGEE